MISEDRLKRLIDTLDFVANFSTCNCHLRGPEHSMACKLGGAAMCAAVDTLRFVLGSGFRKDGAVALYMEDEELQKEVSQWIARGRK